MSGTVFNGKLYVVRVKTSMKKIWEEEDIIYAVAYEGNDGLSFNGFKNICEKNNQRWCVTKKVNYKHELSCSWDQVEETMKEVPPTGEQKLAHTSSALSFLQLATAAYKVKIFTDSEGSAQISKLNAKASKTPNKTGEIIGPHDDAPTMIEKARKDAEKISKYMKDVDTSGLPQGLKVHTYQYTSPQPGPSQSQPSLADINVDEMSKDKLKELVADLKDLVVTANEQINVLTREAVVKDEALAEAEAKITELNAQIKEVKTDTVGFMAAADKAAIDNKILVGDIASEVVKNLKPLLTNQVKTHESPSVAGLPEQVDNVLKRIDIIDKNIANAGKEVKKHADSLQAIIETELESTNNTVEAIMKTFAGVGISAESEGFDIVGSLSSLSNAVLNGGFPQQQQPATAPVKSPAPPKHAGPCTWQSAKKNKNILICNLGCGAQLSVTAPPEHNSAQQAGNSASAGGSYGYGGQGGAQDNAVHNNNGGGKKKRKLPWQNYGAGMNRIQNKQLHQTNVPTQYYNMGAQVQQPQGMPYMGTGNVQYTAYPQQQQQPIQGGNMMQGQVFYGNNGAHGPH